MIGFVWFFTKTSGLFTSGLAGGELSTLFSAAGLSALFLTRLAGGLWQKLTTRNTASTVSPVSPRLFPNSIFNQKSKTYIGEEG